VKAIRTESVPHLLANTYGGFLAQRSDPQWAAQTEQKIRETLQRFIELGLLEQQGDEVQLSLLGRACGQSTLGFESAMRLVEIVRGIDASEVTPFNLVALVQALPEADGGYTPVQRRGRAEAVRVTQATGYYGYAVVSVLRQWVGGELEVWARCKRSVILADWMAGIAVREIETRYSIPWAAEIQLGDIQRFANTTRFHLRSAHQILAALITIGPDEEAQFEAVYDQLEFGVPKDAVGLMKAPFNFARGEYLTAAAQGLGTLPAFQQATLQQLEHAFGRERAGMLGQELGTLADAA
jgi:helicase